MLSILLDIISSGAAPSPCATSIFPAPPSVPVYFTIENPLAVFALTSLAISLLTVPAVIVVAVPPAFQFHET